MNNIVTIYILLSVLKGFMLHEMRPGDKASPIRTLSEGSQIKNCYEASVSCNLRKGFACVWSYRTNGTGMIVGTILRTNQTQNRTLFQISDSSHTTIDLHPSVCWMNDAVLFVAWERNTGENKQIVGRLMNDQGNALSPVFAMSDTSATHVALYPSVQSNSRSEALAVWQDYRDGNPDIYAQQFKDNGTPSGKNVRLNDDTGRALQGVPTISVHNSERFIILWIDNRIESKWSYFYQLWDQGPAGSNMLLDSIPKKDMTMLGSSKWNGPNSAVFAWKDYRNGNSDIFMKEIDVEQKKMKTTKKINDDHDQKWQRLPVLGGDEKKRTIICWEDYRDTDLNQTGDIYAQAFTSSLSRNGKNFRVNDRNEICRRINPQIAVTAAGEYLIVWHQVVGKEYQIAGQWFSYPHKRCGNNFILSNPG